MSIMYGAIGCSTTKGLLGMVNTYGSSCLAKEASDTFGEINATLNAWRIITLSNSIFLLRTSSNHPFCGVTIFQDLCHQI